MPNILDTVQISGSSYDLKDKNAPSVSAVTQQEYDNLPSSAKTSNTFFVITDAQAGDLSQYWTSAQTNSAITQATSGKVDTSTYNTYTAATDTALASKQTTLTAGTGINITDNVISATGGGGGKAIAAGTNISITTGETADTINCTLPITVGGSFNGSINLSGKRTDNVMQGDNQVVQGAGTKATNNREMSIGAFNVSNKANNTWGDSGNTLFSVGNGTSPSARHNAFEIRQNGDIYLSLNGQDVKLQDQLGGGGSSYSAGTGIDITNDVISVSGVVMSSAITTSITSSSTDAQVPSAKAVYDAIQEGGGGGSSYSAGTNIDITNDIISCTLNASNGAGDYSFKEGWSTYANNRCAHAEGEQTIASGPYSHAEGYLTTASAYYSHAEGRATNATNQSEHASGQYNVSSSASTTFGDSGNTLFSVGNGTSNSARHNAFEIRQNGDIYLSLNGQDVKLQDQLGGGGSYVTTDTEQTISGRKIFTYSANSGKAIEFKQTSDSAKVGFRIINSAATNNELATFEFRPDTYTDSSSVKHPLLYLGHYRRTSIANAGVPQTMVGFRQYDQSGGAAYHYLMPLPAEAKTPFSLTTSFKNYFAPLGFKNGSTMITADNTGVVDLSSELGGLKLVKLSQSEYDALATKDNSTLYIITDS